MPKSIEIVPCFVLCLTVRLATLQYKVGLTVLQNCLVDMPEAQQCLRGREPGCGSIYRSGHQPTKRAESYTSVSADTDTSRCLRGNVRGRAGLGFTPSPTQSARTTAVTCGATQSSLQSVFHFLIWIAMFSHLEETRGGEAEPFARAFSSSLEPETGCGSTTAYTGTTSSPKARHPNHQSACNKHQTRTLWI